MGLERRQVQQLTTNHHRQMHQRKRPATRQRRRSKANDLRQRPRLPTPILRLLILSLRRAMLSHSLSTGRSHQIRLLPQKTNCSASSRGLPP